jgi:hypothetical protein
MGLEGLMAYWVLTVDTRSTTFELGSSDSLKERGASVNKCIFIPPLRSSRLFFKCNEF